MVLPAGEDPDVSLEFLIKSELNDLAGVLADRAGIAFRCGQGFIIKKSPSG